MMLIPVGRLPLTAAAENAGGRVTHRIAAARSTTMNTTRQPVSLTSVCFTGASAANTTGSEPDAGQRVHASPLH